MVLVFRMTAVICPVCRVGVSDLPVHLELHTKQEVVLALLTHQLQQQQRSADGQGGAPPEPLGCSSTNPSRSPAATLHIRKTLNNVSIVNNFARPEEGSGLPAASTAGSIALSLAGGAPAQPSGIAGGTAGTTMLVIPSPAAAAAAATIPIGAPLGLLCSSAASGGSAGMFPINLLSGLTSTHLLLPQMNGPTLLVNVPTNYVTYHHQHHHHPPPPQQPSRCGSGGGNATLVLSTANCGIVAGPFSVATSSSSGGDATQPFVPRESVMSACSFSARTDTGPSERRSPVAAVASETLPRSHTIVDEWTTETDEAGPSQNLLWPNRPDRRSSATSSQQINDLAVRDSISSNGTTEPTVLTTGTLSPRRPEAGEVLESPRHLSVISRPEVLLPSATGTSSSQSVSPLRRRWSSNDTRASSDRQLPNQIPLTFTHLLTGSNSINSHSGTFGAVSSSRAASSSVIVSPSWSGGGGQTDPPNTTIVRLD